jgi:hypothetical protein
VLVLEDLIFGVLNVGEALEEELCEVAVADVEGVELMLEVLKRHVSLSSQYAPALQHKSPQHVSSSSQQPFPAQHLCPGLQQISGAQHVHSSGQHPFSSKQQ